MIVSGSLYIFIPMLFFISVFLFAYVMVTRGTSFWGEYEAVFKDTADVNMSDMFLFVDSKRKAYRKNVTVFNTMLLQFVVFKYSIEILLLLFLKKEQKIFSALGPVTVR